MATISHRTGSLTSLGASRDAFKNRTCVSRKRCTTQRAITVPRASFYPNFPLDSDGPGPLHGVLHSIELPQILSETVGPYDARDAIEACTGLWGDDKVACYAIFGVDPAADAWVDVVFSLENSLALETAPDEEAVHHGQERC